VLTRDKHSGTSAHAYDRLVVATGVNPIRPPISGLDLPGVFLLRRIGDATAFDRFLALRVPKHVVIVGGGCIGLEMAEALRRREIEVTIVEMAPSVMMTIDADLGTKVGAELERDGVRLAMGQSVSSISQAGNRLRLEGETGFSCVDDLVLVAVGARPATDLALAAGVSPGFKGTLKVTRRMETNVSNIYAAGDCVETWHRITIEQLSATWNRVAQTRPDRG
jgi:pyruvate/2-oxoglutarate dehydrogenase complex dihydrolipoamide dehydrogenase (E3) component